MYILQGKSYNEYPENSILAECLVALINPLSFHHIQTRSYYISRTAQPYLFLYLSLIRCFYPRAPHVVLTALVLARDQRVGSLTDDDADSGLVTAGIVGTRCKPHAQIDIFFIPMRKLKLFFCFRPSFFFFLKGPFFELFGNG